MGFGIRSLSVPAERVDGRQLDWKQIKDVLDTQSEMVIVMVAITQG